MFYLLLLNRMQCYREIDINVYTAIQKVFLIYPYIVTATIGADFEGAEDPNLPLK